MDLSQSERTTQVELVKRVAMDQTTLSRNLAVRVSHKWVASKAEGRERCYRITKAGQAILTRAKPRWKKAQDRMQQALGTDWEIVMNAINRLTAAAMEEGSS